MSVNKVILVGNVGTDPEVRFLDRNAAISSFRLATSERGYTMQNGTVVPDRTEWHNIVLWRQLAEWSEKYLKKGMLVYIEGKLQTRIWDKDGITHYRTEIVASNVQVLRYPEGYVAPRQDNPVTQPSPAPQPPYTQPAPQPAPESSDPN